VQVAWDHWCFHSKIVNRPTEQSKRIQASAACCDISLAVTNPILWNFCTSEVLQHVRLLIKLFISSLQPPIFITHSVSDAMLLQLWSLQFCRMKVLFFIYIRLRFEVVKGSFDLLWLVWRWHLLKKFWPSIKPSYKMSKYKKHPGR